MTAQPAFELDQAGRVMTDLGLLGDRAIGVDHAELMIRVAPVDADEDCVGLNDDRLLQH
jgi:hypothetical protein